MDIRKQTASESRPTNGLTGWLLARLRGDRRPGPHLVLVERITLAPRHSLALIEAEGRRLLVATSAEGAPVFYALDERARPVTHPRSAARVSW